MVAKQCKKGEKIDFLIKKSLKLEFRLENLFFLFLESPFCNAVSEKKIFREEGVVPREPRLAYAIARPAPFPAVN